MEKNSGKMIISSCCEQNVPAGEALSISCEKQYVLLYITCGNAKMLLDKKEYKVKENHVALVRPKQDVKITALESSVGCIYFFYAGGEADYLSDMSLFKQAKPLYRAKDKELYTCFRSILEEAYLGHSNRYNCVSEVLHIFSVVTPKIKNREASKYVNGYLQKAIAEIESHPDLIIKVNELAECVAVSRSYLYKIFMEETGFSPREFIIDYKLQQSAEKLKSKKEKIQSVFIHLGFSSYHFAEKAFKKKYGITPREYRLKYSSNSKRER